MNKAEALQILRPGAQWVLRGDVLEWLDTIQIQPTEQEIQNCINANSYKELRASEYPPIADYLDGLYHQAHGDDSFLSAYWSKVQAVKDAYPKPQ